ncbi:TPA: DUF1642 domain-containing protein [Listeria innocua]|uniref:DUF1642 domain-containing protein n=1 Tax=Listeria monocytogenes TaxID=1639 RepID=UPI0010D68403|nr:DUF1642 domain-containing protein [Listeria monocytogenes]HBN5050583.1 DUF1642 domain-containing protein [Listeria innocua]EDB1645360.1 DUF1642 domain-containing protein [Listeria monocytogenes]EDC3862357.1 DUF1642 domain-containing protein [Listeria monocytogenes]EDF4463445.1 DUF1642 domain-containing protein [Listeria monocytogenes]MCI2543224.1 DUF1642 domain-containing protein [Listeria monocytogenes]
MNFKVGDRVELILRSKKRVGTVEEVYNDTQKCKVQIDEFPVTVPKPQKYLVKAKESELVVVPQFVADWIEQKKANGDHLYIAMDKSWQSMNYKVSGWLEDREDSYDKFARAWLDGYEVEKEPLYYVKLIDQATGYLNVRNDGRRSMSNSVQNEIFKTKFTESEIKAMDKGEVYWLLNEPVEGVEGEA